MKFSKPFFLCFTHTSSFTVGLKRLLQVILMILLIAPKIRWVKK